MKWFEDYVEKSKPPHRASITAHLHTEHLNTREKMQDFADKLILCQEHDVQITINMVMVLNGLNAIGIMPSSSTNKESTLALTQSDHGK